MILGLFLRYSKSTKPFRIFKIAGIILIVYLVFIRNSLSFRGITFHDTHLITDRRWQPGTVAANRLGILVVSDLNAQQKYAEHAITLSCYANRHGYTFYVIDPTIYHTCSSFSNFFFKKQCSVLLFLIQHAHIDWLLVLGGDTFVINASKKLENYIPNDNRIHMVFYERFLYGEIMADNYLVHNHPWSYLFLNKWIEFFPKLPQVSYHNHDNGALHLVFLDMVGKLDSMTFNKCYKLYLTAHDEEHYLNYVGCTKCALGGTRRFEHVILLRRGHGFARDMNMPESGFHTNDFLIHGYKFSLHKFFSEPLNRSSCRQDALWFPKVRSVWMFIDLNAARAAVKRADHYASTRYPHSVVSDISNCWPNCPQEITGETLDLYTKRLCSR